MYKLKIAAKHLDPCDVTKCRFNSCEICCFGLRHEGCIYLNPVMEHQIDMLATVEMQLVVAKYEADPWWAAETRNDQIDFPSN